MQKLNSCSNLMTQSRDLVIALYAVLEHRWQCNLLTLATFIRWYIKRFWYLKMFVSHLLVKICWMLSNWNIDSQKLLINLLALLCPLHIIFTKRTNWTKTGLYVVYCKDVEESRTMWKTLTWSNSSIAIVQQNGKSVISCLVWTQFCRVWKWNCMTREWKICGPCLEKLNIHYLRRSVWVKRTSVVNISSGASLSNNLFDLPKSFTSPF